jgi:hypothetical protein
MSDWQYSVSPEAVAELLRGGGEFNPPERILSDLTEEEAVAVPPGAPHSVSQIVAHLHWAQDGLLAHLRGENWPHPAHLDDTFAPIPPGSWRPLVASFLAGIEACREMALEAAETTSPDREDTSVPYDLAENALHNAYHLGQIVLLRRIQGLWPPAGGDANDF